MVQIEFLKRIISKPGMSTSVYLLKEPVVSEATIFRTAKQFGLEANESKGMLSSTIQQLSYSEGPLFITLNRYSGALKYRDNTRWQVDNGTSQLELSDDDAVSIAKKYIRNSDIAPLDECRLLRITHLHVGTMEKGSNKSAERIIDACVAFQRIIDGVPVEGPGGKVGIYIDTEGKVSGCDRIWRQIDKEYQKLSTNELKAPEDVERELIDYYEPLKIRKVMVKDTRFGYFEQGPKEMQRYLQPVYIMPVAFSDDKRGPHMESFFISPAHYQSRDWIMPPLKRTKDQPPRQSG